MSVIKLNLDLRPKGEALLAQNMGGEVLFSQTDQMEAKPLMLWMTNMVPTKQGMASTSELPQVSIAALPVGLPTIDSSIELKPFIVFDGTGASTYCMYLDGKFLSFSPTIGKWVEVATATAGTAHPTEAFLRGKTYLHHKEAGLLTFAAGFGSTTVETLSGVVVGLLKGITTTSNYLIAWDDDTIYWSSPSDPLEFTPVVATVATGAGSARIQQVRGTIVTCLPSTDGITIYTTKNAVSMVFSNNSARPWIWREVRGSTGVLDSAYVSAEANSNTHFVWTTSGLQLIEGTKATIIFPEISDFLGGDEFNRIAASDNTLESVIAPSIAIAVNFVSNRYLCISYGEVDAHKEFILIYDTALERWGRIKSDHLAVFAFTDPELVSDTTYDMLTLGMDQYTDVKCSYWKVTDRKNSISPSTLAIVKPDGSINKIELTRNDTVGRKEDQDSNGELLIGDIKVSRDKQCLLSTIQLYGEFDEATLTVETESTNGKVPTIPFPDPKVTGKFLSTASGDSHKLRINGKFTISNVVLSLLQTGYM